MGDFYSDTQVPIGAPPGTRVVHIPPGDGRSGYFKISFRAPNSFSDARVAGRANVDDFGVVYLNKHRISPALFDTNPNEMRIDEFSNAQFQAASGVIPNQINEILIVDANFGGGPSACSFYIVVTFTP